MIKNIALFTVFSFGLCNAAAPADNAYMPARPSSPAAFSRPTTPFKSPKKKPRNIQIRRSGSALKTLRASAAGKPVKATHYLHAKADDGKTESAEINTKKSKENKPEAHHAHQTDSAPATPDLEAARAHYAGLNAAAKAAGTLVPGPATAQSSPQQGTPLSTSPLHSPHVHHHVAHGALLMANVKPLMPLSQNSTAHNSPARTPYSGSPLHSPLRASAAADTDKMDQLQLEPSALKK